MIAIVAVCAFPSSAVAQSTYFTKIPQTIVDKSISYLEKDYPNVDWSQAPAPRCFNEVRQKKANALHRANKSSQRGVYRPLLKRVRVNCAWHITDKQKVSIIAHEFIHWMQYELIGRDDYNCIGSIEAEAYQFEIKHFGVSIYGRGAFRYNTRRNLKNMSACLRSAAKKTHPFY